MIGDQHHDSSAFRHSSDADLAILEHSGKQNGLPLAVLLHPNVIDALFEEIGPRLRLVDAHGRTFYNGVALVADVTSGGARMRTADNKLVDL